MDLKQLQDSTKDLKVLYVEDSMMMRKVTHKILTAYFNHIDLAKDGKEAFELYSSYYDKNKIFYDIVITDLEMPVLDGEQLSRKIIDYNVFQEIIVISSVGEFARLVNLMNLGVNKFISKPIEDEQLAQVIEQIYQNIYIKRLQEQEKLEIQEYNKVLKEKEDVQAKILAAKAKEAKEFNQALDDSAIVAKTDIKGVIKYVNQHYCDISGYEPIELIGYNISIVSSGNRPSSYFKKLWNTINNKKTYKTIFENKTKDGSLFYIETTINPILDVNDEITEFIAVSHDVTRLMKSLADVKKAKKAKEDFFINISHEMKTPLNSILAFSALLKKRLSDDAKSLLMVTTINETGNDLNKLIESIIDMRKIQDNTLELKEVAFNPQEEISKCINKFVNDSFDKNQKYETFIDSELPNTLVGDPTRITQVIAIVIDNAIKFTDDGGNISINIEYEDVNECLVCNVEDNGIGIAKENQDKIFNLGQLDSKVNRAHEGAGIGLNIAYNLLKTMKGKISLKSIPTKGSVFKLEFPLKKI